MSCLARSGLAYPSCYESTVHNVVPIVEVAQPEINVVDFVPINHLASGTGPKARYNTHLAFGGSVDALNDNVYEHMPFRISTAAKDADSRIGTKSTPTTSQNGKSLATSRILSISGCKDYGD
jgi:hypothetical protein